MGPGEGQPTPVRSELSIGEPGWPNWAQMWLSSAKPTLDSHAVRYTIYFFPNIRDYESQH